MKSLESLKKLTRIFSYRTWSFLDVRWTITDLSRLRILPFLAILPILVAAQFAMAEDPETTGIFRLGADDEIRVMIEDDDGNLYFGGTFRELGGESGRIVMYDGENWRSLGYPTINIGPGVSALAIRGDYLYAGGRFSSIVHNGETVPARNLARYHFPSDTWEEAGGGVNDGVALIKMVDNLMYVGGLFTRSHDGTTLNRIGILSTGGSWTQIVTGTTDHEFIGFPNGGVNVVYRDPETNLLYFGGSILQARIYDPEYELSDGYRLAMVGGIVTWNGNRFGMVGGGVHYSRASDLLAGTIIHIERDPYGSGLLVAGFFGIAYNSERTGDNISSHNPETDPQTAGIAIWNGSSWSDAMSLWDHRSGGQQRVWDLHFTSDRIYVIGDFNGGVRPLANFDGTTLRAEGILAWDRSTNRYFMDGNQSGIGFVETAPGVSAHIRTALNREDGLYLAGSIPRYQLPVGGTPVTMNHLMRYDGENFWQVGAGVDGTVLHVITKLSNGEFIVGGNFRRIHNHDGDNHQSPLVARYNPNNGKLSPLGGGISAGGVTNARVLSVTEDPQRGDIYVGGLFINGINSDGSLVNSRGLLRWADGQWHEVAGLAGGGARYIPKARVVKIIDDYLYFGGFFSSIPDRDPNQLSLGRMNLETGQFVPIPIPENLSMVDRLVTDLEVKGDYIYVLMESHNSASVLNGSVFRIHRETDHIDVFNNRFPGIRSHERIQARGEFLLISGRFSQYQTLSDDGEILDVTQSDGNSFVFHPETDTWWAFDEWFSRDDFGGGTWAYDAFAFENSFYVATGASENGVGLHKLDLGTREWTRPAPNLGNSEFARSPTSHIYSIYPDGNNAWLTGSFTVPGTYLATTQLDAGTPGPHLLFNPPADEISLSTGDIETLRVAFGNLGSGDLTWNLAVDDAGLPEGLVTVSATSGSVGGQSYGAIDVTINATEVPTGFYHAEITITTNDSHFNEISLPLAIYTNRLREVSVPIPVDGAMNVAIDGVLRWDGDPIADSVWVYLDETPDFTEESLVYEGEFIDTLSLGGLVQYYTQYFWQVRQTNAASTTESDVWSFQTQLDPDEGIWIQVDTDFSTNLDDILFADAETGFALGNRLVFRTEDGGATWEQLEDDLLGGVRYGMAALGEHLWLGLAGGNMVYTSDGGDTWAELSTEVSTQLEAVFFHDADHGWVGGRNGSLQRTTDGGQTWTVINIDNTTRINRIQFVDMQTGYLVGNSGLIMKTTDGGDTWSTLTTSITSHLNSLKVHSADHVHAGGNFATILETRDGGDTWDVRFQGDRNNNNIFDIRFIDDQMGWAVGLINVNTTLMLITFDGGATWAQRPTPRTTGSLNGLFATEEAGVWAVGGGGTILRYGDQDEIIPDPEIPERITLLLPENNATDISLRPGFSWQPDAASVTYQLQLALDDSFSDIVLDRSGMSFVQLTPDEPLAVNTVYFWRVRGMSGDGAGDWSAVRSFTTRTDVGTVDDGDIPVAVQLDQNYPNPFNPVTKIRFGIPETSEVRLSVYNILGQLVAVPVQEVLSAGWHTVGFDGSGLSSGTYIYRLHTGGAVHTRKFMLVK